MSDKKVWEMRTKSGLPLDEAVSWLQKSLRRADEITALWLMEDLLVSGFQRYALYRCWITALEDVGLAAPEVCRSITEVYQAWLAHRKEKGKDFVFSGENRVINGYVILLIARSPKNRATDDVSQLVAQKYREGWRPEFNEILVRDEHTSKGKGLGRKYRHWVHVGSKCKNLVSGDEIGGPTYKEETEEMWERLAQENSEPEAETDPDVERLGLK